MKKLLIASLVSASLVITSVAPAFAEDVQSTQPAPVEEKVVVGNPVDTQPVVEPSTNVTPAPVTEPEKDLTLSEVKSKIKDMVEVAVVKDIDPKIVEQLRAKNFGYGKIALIVGLSQKSGKTIDEVVKALEENKGLGKTAQALGIKLVDFAKVQRDIQKKVAVAEKEFKENVEKELVKNIDPKVVEQLRAKNFGYGKIVLVVKLSEKSGKTIDEVVTILAENKGLSKTAEALGINLEDLKVINTGVDKAKALIEKEKVKIHIEKLKREVQKGKTELKKDYSKLKELLEQRAKNLKNRR